MTFYQTYQEFVNETTQFNHLSKQSILNRLFSIYDQALIFELFHQEHGVWFCYIDLKSQYSRFLVSFDVRFKHIVETWAHPLDVMIKQQKIMRTEIDSAFPKLCLHFNHPNDARVSLIYSGHPTRPYVRMTKDEKTIFTMGNATEEIFTWKAVMDHPTIPWQDKVANPSFMWQRIFERLAAPYENKILLAIKLKTKKIDVYELDQKEHLRKTLYQALAEHLITLNLSKMDVDHYLFNHENFPIDRRLSSGQNASRYYKKAKKADIGLQQVQKQAKMNFEEIKALEFHLEQLKSLTLTSLTKTITFLINQRFISSEKKVKKNIDVIPQDRPYFLFQDQIKISFGKNQVQNDALTFGIASKKDYFFHIAHQSGSHVVLHCTAPTHEQLLFTGKLVLALARQTDGEVHYTAIKYVKKTKTKGLVKLEKYQSMKIKLSSFNLDDLLQSAKRY
jgi:hypothetical protein